MVPQFDAKATAAYLFDCHINRVPYEALKREIAPGTIEQAYQTQDELAKLLIRAEGPIAGFKIATTTKVMQALLGIDHPCGGLIFAKRIFESPARLQTAKYMNLGIECELAVRLGRDLSTAEAPFTAGSVASAVAAVMPAFELIEDRKADYKDPEQTNAFSLIAENGWNAGAVLGTPSSPGQGRSLVGIEATLRRNEVVIHTGMTEDPFAALAWVANSVLARGYAMRAGSVVITGSVIPTLVSVQAGDRLEFELADLGSTALVAV